MSRIPLRGMAASEVEIRSEAGADLDDTDVKLVLDRWTGSSLVFPSSEAAAIASGLCVLSNACEEEARLVRTSPQDREERRALVHASRGLATAMSAAIAIVRNR